MILLRDKSFSSNAQLKRPTHVAKLQTIGFIKEVIKLIEFYDKQHNMVHWIRQEIVGRYFRETLRARHLITDCFVRAVEDENTKLRINLLVLDLMIIFGKCLVEMML